MKSRALNIAKRAFEADAAIERDAAGGLHRALDRPDRRLAGERAGDHRAVRRLGAGHRGLGVMDQLIDRHRRGGEGVLHLADQIGQMPVIRLMARDLQRLGAGALGDAEIGGVDQRKGEQADDMEQHVPFALLAPAGDRRVRNEHVLQLDIMRARPAHPEDMPSIEDRDALGLQRHREMQYRRSRVGIVMDRARHQQVARGAAAGEDLARVDQEPALGFDGRAGALQPVGAAARHEDQIFRRDALQQPVGRRVLMAPAPCRGRDKVRVHREGQRRRAAARGKAADRMADLGVPGAAAAEFGGD
jgi:hypothetical protein